MLQLKHSYTGKSIKFYFISAIYMYQKIFDIIFNCINCNNIIINFFFNKNIFTNIYLSLK